MDTKDGGPAFPNPLAQNSNYQMQAPDFPGMSLRQYYAAAALTGLVSRVGHGDYIDEDFPGCVVRDAFRIADGMIAHEKGESK